MRKNTWEIIRKELAEKAETTPENISEFKIDFIKETAEILFVAPLEDETDDGRVTIGLTYFRWSNSLKVVK